MTTRVPDPAYPAKDSAVLYGDKGLYARLGKVAEQDGGKDLVQSFEIPIRSGRGWVVKKGGLISCSSQFRSGFGDVQNQKKLWINLREISLWIWIKYAV